jgi:hypothetical protein
MHRETMESYLVTTWLLEYQRLSSRFKPFTPLTLRAGSVEKRVNCRGLLL